MTYNEKGDLGKQLPVLHGKHLDQHVMLGSCDGSVPASRLHRGAFSSYCFSSRVRACIFFLLIRYVLDVILDIVMQCVVEP